MSLYPETEIRSKEFVPVVVEDAYPDWTRLRFTLKHLDSGRELVLRVDAQAGAVIQLLSNNDAVPVPLPQQLVASMALALGARVVAGIVTDRNDFGSYCGIIRVRAQDGDVDIASRASDAIAVAIAAGGEVLVADHLLQEQSHARSRTTR